MEPDLGRIIAWFTQQADSPWDLMKVSGVCCGSLVFLLHSKEPSALHKTLYFVISIIGGFAISPVVQQQLPQLPEWLASFLSAAAIVTLAIALLEWTERSVPTLLTEEVRRVLGQGGENSASNRPNDDGSR